MTNEHTKSSKRVLEVPIEHLTSRKKSTELDGLAWTAALAATGQPKRFE